MTQQTHLAQITQWISQNQQSVGISPTTILQFLDYANRRIWKSVAPTQPDIFKKVITGVNDGALQPADWTIYAGRANYVDGSSIVRPFHYIHPEQIGEQSVNSYGMATASFPAIYFEDQCIRTLPSGLTGLTIEYFNQPVAMVGAGPTTDDGMPPSLSSYVHMECAEALRELSADEHKSDETLLRRMKESNDLNERIDGLFQTVLQNAARSTVKP